MTEAILHPERTSISKSEASAPGSSASTASIQGVPPNMFWANTFVTGVSLVFSIVATAAAWWEAKEVKQLQIQVMDQNALLIREGLKQPGDEMYGPSGNLEYQPRRK